MGSVQVGPEPKESPVGLVARSGKSGWYRVGGWYGEQPLIRVDGELKFFNTNEVVEVVYDPHIWEFAK